MKNLMRIYRIMIRYWGFLVAGLALMLGYALFSGVSLTMIIPVFDQVFMPRQTPPIIHTSGEFLLSVKLGVLQCIHGVPFAKWFDTATWKPLVGALNHSMGLTDPFLLLTTIVWVSAALFLLKNIFYYSNQVMFTNLRGKTVRDIRQIIFEHYLQQSVAFAGKNRVGDSLVRMINDVDIVSTQYIVCMAKLFRDTVTVLILARIGLLLNARMFLYSALIIPIFALSVGYVGQKIRKYAKRLQNQFSLLFSAVEEVLNNMKIVKAFGREQFERMKIKKIIQVHFKFWRKGELYNAFNIPLGEMNGLLIGMVVLLMGGRMVLDHRSFTFGTFTAFLLTIFSMLKPLKEVSKSYVTIKKAYVSLERISVILDLQPEIVEDPQPIVKPTFEREIELRNVDFAYDTDTQVLKNISLTIRKGETVALVGSSGSGKTTLVNLLPRLYDATSGEIRIDGVPMKKIRTVDLRTLFGIVTQEPILFNESIRFNVAYGTLKPVTDEQIHQACRIAYADEFIEKMPNGYDTMLDVHGGNLSGGQKQRLCIARAVVGDPPILILDEATSALDTESERHVQDAIDEATRNRTVVVIAHRLSTIINADRIVVMDQGQILGMGPHEELLRSCERYRVLYEMQFGMDHEQ